jgi:hypothetical protein
MGDRGEPYGVLLCTSYGTKRVEPILRETDRPVRNERVHRHTLSGKPFCQKTCVTCSGLTLLKKPEMSKRRRAPTLLVWQVACILCMRVAMVLMVLCCRRELNCDIGRRSAEMISAFTLLATIFSKSLAMHSRRLMGR